jgi:MFS family permease
MFFNTGYALVISFIPGFLVGHGISMRDAGLAASVITWAVIGAIPAGGLLLDRTGRANALMTISFGTMGLTALLATAMPSPILFALLGVSVGLPAGATMTLPAEVLQQQNRETGLAITYTWYYAGIAVITPIAGLMRDLFGDARMPLLCAGCLEIAAIGALALFRLCQRRWQPYPMGIS